MPLGRVLSISKSKTISSFTVFMNTASKLGPHTQSDRGTFPGVGSVFTIKAAALQEDNLNSCPAFIYVGLSPVVARARVLAHEVLDLDAQAIVRGGTRCASQVLDRGAQANARGTTHALDGGVQAVARGAARCALHVHCRGARTDACGRSFAVLSTQVSTVGLRLRLVVPRPMTNK